MSIRPVPHIIAASLAFVFVLTGCGGGGGGDGNADAAPNSTAAAAPAITSVANLVPGATMTWATMGERTISLSLQSADGRPAAGAAVRAFTLSRSSPQDGSPLEEPVAMSLLDTVVSDLEGRATLALRLPSHIDELLVVATVHDTQARAVLPASTDADVTLRLAR